MKQILCNECTAKVRLAMPGKELVRRGDRMQLETCGVCRKKRYCGEYELVDKQVLVHKEDGV